MEPDDNIIIYPKFKELKEEIERLKIELSMLVSERDELKFAVAENLKAQYYLEFGALEYKVYQAECLALRLKRKLELIQTRINRQEPVVLVNIELILDQEFAEYKEKLDEKIAQINSAIERSRLEKMTEKQSAEFKKMYREIVKALHPDFNPNLSSEQIKLFHTAVEAYKNGAFFELKLIYELISENRLPEDINEDTMSALKKRRDELKALANGVAREIQKMKSEFPFTVEEIISDPEKGERHRSRLESIKAEYDAQIEYYKGKIKEFLI